MFLLKKLSKKPFIGLDFQHNEIHLLGLKPTAKGYIAAAAGITEVPFVIAADGRLESSDALLKALTRLVQELGIAGCAAAIALPFQYVMTKQISLPGMSNDDECSKEIAAQIPHYFPGIKEPVYYDFVSVDKANDQISTEFQLFAARKELIDSYVALINQAGLHLSIVDIDTRVLPRAAAFIQPHTTAAFVEKNEDAAQLMVFRDDQLIFHQRIAMNSSEFIREFKLAMQMIHLNCRALPITQLILSGDEFSDEHLQELQNVCAVEIKKYNFSHFMTCMKQLDVDGFATMSPRLWRSLGLALRGCRARY